MGEVRWTSEAERWLREIHDYIAGDNPSAALRTVEGIYAKAEILAEFPEIGYRYQASPEADVRILLYSHFRITYHVRRGGVDVLGVFHGALDIERFL